MESLTPDNKIRAKAYAFGLSKIGESLDLEELSCKSDAFYSATKKLQHWILKKDLDVPTRCFFVKALPSLCLNLNVELQETLMQPLTEELQENDNVDLQTALGRATAVLARNRGKDRFLQVLRDCMDKSTGAERSLTSRRNFLLHALQLT